MRKLLTWIVVTLGIAAVVRKLRQRGATGGSHAQTEDPDPAGELRRKLDDSRESEGTSATPQPNVDDRRSEVHDQGRAAIDEMQRSTD